MLKKKVKRKESFTSDYDDYSDGNNDNIYNNNDNYQQQQQQQQHQQQQPFQMQEVPDQEQRQLFHRRKDGDIIDAHRAGWLERLHWKDKIISEADRLYSLNLN